MESEASAQSQSDLQIKYGIGVVPSYGTRWKAYTEVRPAYVIRDTPIEAVRSLAEQLERSESTSFRQVPASF